MSGEAPDWARDQAEDVHIMLVATKEANIETIAQALTDAEQSGYERGRKEGIEEAAKVADGGVDRYGSDPWTNGYRCAAADIEEAIRQLLEVKSEDRVEKTEKT